jgi:putative ABC transport system permease protein
MKLSNVVRLYRIRLRSRLVQEMFAVVGISVGVGLLFASQVASASLNGSVRQVTAGIVGTMRLQLVARAPQGFSEQLLEDVRRLPGVNVAVPVLDERVSISGSGGSEAVDLIGTDPRFARVGGPLVRRLGYSRLASLQAIAVPTPVAQAIGAQSLHPVRLQIGDLTPTAFLGTTLGTAEIGALVNTPVALGPLAYVQGLANMKGRLTRVLVQPRSGAEGLVMAGLQRLAGGTLNVRPAQFEATLFAQAAGPTNQSTVLFAAISALVGFLFAFNAMLLTVPQRRKLVEDLRLDGYTAGMIARVLLFDALVLGVAASLLGLVLGELLSLGLFNASPGYLSLGFPVGSQRIVPWQSIALAVGGGLAAACVGVFAPLRREIFHSLASAFSHPRHTPQAGAASLAVGVACVALTTVILLVAPQAAIAGIVSLIVALLLLLPAVLSGVVSAFDRLRRPFAGVSAYLAVIELRSRTNRARALAIGATGAIAVFGSVAIQGAHSNLQRGLDRLVHQLNANAQLWVIPPGANNLLATTPFPAIDTKPLTRLAGIVSVRPLLGGLLDYQQRRVWVLAPPTGAPFPIPPSQLVSGDLTSARARLAAGGWAVVSQALVSEHHLRVGQSFELPSPRPMRFRVAASITNLGWPPGAIILNQADYARAWASTDPSAYYVTLASGVSPQQGRLDVQRALGPASGLGVETAGQRELRQRSASRQGLQRLTEISLLVLIAAVLAMSAAMGSMIWQRRVQLADMKVDGFRDGELWRGLLLESLLLLGSACSIGAVFGIYGQVLLSHALATVTGFPVVFSADVSTALESFLAITALAVVMIAIPGHLASRVRPAISFQE